MTGITRRRFLKTGAGAVGLTLVHLNASWVLAGELNPRALSVTYDDFESIYRNKWRWDKVAKGTHNVNCWYQRQCMWNVYVKDGIAWREEQTATYETVEPGIPDYNPRGCQKGCSFSQRMYDGSRIRYPLKRAGERGEGKWKRVSWDEALSDIADTMIDAMISEHGPDSMIVDTGTGAWGLEMLSGIRFGNVIGMPQLDVNSEIGDHRPGIAVVAGTEEICSSMDDLFHSDLIFIWGGNPLYTQIPNAHYITEARYNGSKVICIAPDFSASAVHTDQWVPIKIGTDAALGLSMAHVMIEEGIYKKRFVQEQTDLPLLRRVDNGKFLRESDIKAEGSDQVFYLYDLNSKTIVPASAQTLELGDLEPALEGEFDAEILAGTIKVQTVFSTLREHLKQYTPELASKICGVDPETIRGLAHDLASCRAAQFLTQSNFSKFYHGLEMERAQVLCCVLAGQIGHKGAGYQGFPSIYADGFDILAALKGKDGVEPALGVIQQQMEPAVQGMMAQGLTYEMVIHEFARMETRHGQSVPTMMWLYFQAGLDKMYGASQSGDPYMKRPLSSYMEESLKNGWQFKQDTPTKVLICNASNPLRRFRGYHEVEERLVPQLDLLVSLDFRMSNTCMQSDYVLPGAGWYEYDEIMWSTPLMPYLQVTTEAVKPLGESKTAYEMYYLITKHIQKRAVERGLTEYKDRHGQKRTFDVYDQITFGGQIDENNRRGMIDLFLKLTSNAGGVTWDELAKKGWHRYTGCDQGYMNVGNSTVVKQNETMVACTYHTEKKIPWPTLTRRLQFCIDHPFYEELNEVLPIHKDPPGFGGNHPIQLTGGHTRWSIHAAWRDHEHIARLRRGVPVVFVSAEDAAARGIEDGDMVHVFNDLSSVEFQACVAPATRPGQAIVYHAWEKQQFNGAPYDALFGSPINPVQLAGGYGHLQPRPSVFSPGQHDRGTYVDIAKL